MKLAIRSMVAAPKGFSLIAFDLSQAESWVVAHLANEPNMKRALKFGDIHTETTGSALMYADTGCPHVWKKGSTLCGLCQREVTSTARYIGKAYNHASSYRMGPEQAARLINKNSDKPPYLTVTIKESKRYYTAWHRYYNLKIWWAEVEKNLSDTRTITTTYGRTRMFFAGWGPELFKEATAYDPQSTVADHFNGALHPQLRIRGGLLAVYQDLIKPYKDHRLINQAHDSGILEVPTVVVPELVPQVRQLMSRSLVIKDEEFVIPVDIEFGQRWSELEKVT